MFHVISNKTYLGHLFTRLVALMLMFIVPFKSLVQSLLLLLTCFSEPLLVCCRVPIVYVVLNELYSTQYYWFHLVNVWDFGCFYSL